MDYKVYNIEWNVDNYTKQKVNLSLPKQLIISSGSLPDNTHNNIVELNKTIAEYLQGIYGFNVIKCDIE